MVRHRAFNLLQHARAGQGEHAVRLGEAGQVGEVVIVGHEVRERSMQQDRVEEIRLERQRPRVGLDGGDALLDARVTIRCWFSAALNHRSVAHTCTPNSRARKID